VGGKKLKVLFLATRDWNNPATTGGDNTLWENARYLASAGHEVTYVAAAFAGAAKRETLDGIHVIRLGGIHSLWLTTFIRYMRSWRGRFDVVIAEGFGGSRIPRLAPLYVREPVITEWHQIHRDLFAIQYPRLMNGPLNLLERVTAWVHRNTLVRAGTEEWKEAFPTIGFKPDHVFVVPVSIRDDWLSESNGSLSTEPNILWLGKLRRYKCPDHIIRAMPTIINQVKAARLVIAGRRDDPDYEKELRDLAEQLGVQRSIDFSFDVSDTEKRRLIQESRVMVLPSAVEGFGIVVLEANAYGIPVVASSGVPEGAVRHGYNGLRFKFGNIEALAQNVVQLLQDPALYSTLSTNASSNAKRFSWSRVGAEFETVVRQASATAQSTR
jgi:glycosyltransferase involved in cell wall biosynthesis